MKKLKIYNRQDILALKPCEDIPENWTGTLIDILDYKEYRESERIWCVLRLVDKATIMKFAQWCISQTYRFTDCDHWGSVVFYAEAAATAHSNMEDIAEEAVLHAATGAVNYHTAIRKARQHQINKLKELILKRK